jgi:hypothetical protein
MIFGLIQGICFLSDSAAQYPPKMSTTGPEAAETRVGLKGFGQGLSEAKLGALNFKANTSLELSYNDNISLSETAPDSDFIIKPGVGFDASMQLTPLNGIKGSLSFAYEKHISHPELDTFGQGRGADFPLLNPGSGLDFTFYTSGIIFTIYTRPIIEQDPVSIPQLSNVTSFRRLSNDAGLTMETDLNKIFVNFGYNHHSFESFEDRFNFLDHTAESFNATVGLRVNPRLNTGLLSSFTLTSYGERIQNDSTSKSVGAFASMTVSDFVSVGANVSFQTTSFDNNGSIGDSNSTIGDTADFNSIVYSLSVQNQLNRYMNHSVQVSRFTTLGVGSNFTDIHKVSYYVSADVIRNVTTTLNYNLFMTGDSNPHVGEEADQHSIEPIFLYQPHEHFNVKLTYRHTIKSSGRAGNSYTQNLVSVAGIYTF